MPSLDKSDGEAEIVFLDQLLIEAMGNFNYWLSGERDIYIQCLPSQRIKSHYDKLSRILVSLLNNAKYTRRPGTKIEIIGSINWANLLTISVKDEDRGIALREFGW